MDEQNQDPGKAGDAAGCKKENRTPARSLNTGPFIFCCLYPAILTFFTFYLEIGYPLSYAAGKLVMVLIPVAVWWKFKLNLRVSLGRSGFFKTRCIPGIVTGILFSGIITSLYYFVFKGNLDPKPVIEKVNSLGIMKYYWFTAIFLSLVNSLMEEYYWRAFIYSELRSRSIISSKLMVCLAGGALFGIHHIFPLIRYFPLQYAAVFIFGTMVAGGAWTAMRVRGYSIIDCYVSHIFADLAIFYVGWDLIHSGV